MKIVRNGDTRFCTSTAAFRGQITVFGHKSKPCLPFLWQMHDTLHIHFPKPKIWLCSYQVKHFDLSLEIFYNIWCVENLFFCLFLIRFGKNRKQVEDKLPVKTSQELHKSRLEQQKRNNKQQQITNKQQQGFSKQDLNDQMENQAIELKPR